MKVNMMKSTLFKLACILLLSAASAYAGTATSTFAVTATVTANCTITANALAFGAYDPIVAQATTPLNVNSTVSVTCTNGSPATITMDQGLHPAAGSTAAAPLRQMIGATSGQFLSYGIFQNAALTTIWGNTAGTGAANTGSGVAQTVQVFGTIPQAQNVPADSFSDSVVATITF